MPFDSQITIAANDADFVKRMINDRLREIKSQIYQGKTNLTQSNQILHNTKMEPGYQSKIIADVKESIMKKANI